MIQRYDEANGIDYECGEIACSAKGKYVLYADHIAEVQRLREQVRVLREALNAIATSPHRAYDGNAPYVSEHSSGYALGIADGHRCSANTARAALAATEPRQMTTPAPRPPLDVPQMWLMVAAIARNLAAMGFVAKEKETK